jgi:sugar/nucleoside kinase (ribokinase family)
MGHVLGDVGCLGDFYCDIILRGVSRLPRWGEEVFGEEPVMCPGGIANVGVGLSRLGVSAKIMARTRGDDTISRVLVEELAQYPGLEVEWLRRAPTTAITVALPHGTERAMVSYLPPVAHGRVAPYVPWDRLKRVTHLHLGAWEEGGMPLQDQTAILAEAQAREMTTSLDVSWQGDVEPAERLRELLARVDIFFPNAAEARWVADTSDLDEALEQLACLVPVVVVKLGRDGALARSGDTVERVPGYETRVVDTTGAGDAFAAGFLYGAIRHWPLRRSLALANVCGTISVSRIGSSISTPTRREAFEMLQGSYGGTHSSEMS